MSQALDAAGATGLDFFARVMMNRYEDKQQDARTKALQEAQLILEERRADAAEARAKRRITGNSSVYKGVGVGPDGPSQNVDLVDLTNAAGETVSRREASRPEIAERDQMLQQRAIAEEDRKAKLEDREFKRKDMEARTGIAGRNASASERRASAAEARANRPPALVAAKDTRMSQKDANAQLLQLARDAQESGMSQKEYAKQNGIDYESLQAAASRNAAPKKPSVIDRIGSALSGVGSAMADAFKQPKADGKGEKKDAPPKAGVVVDGYRFKGGDPSDPKNWTPVK